MYRWAGPLVLLLCAATPLAGQAPASRAAAQREAMSRLRFLAGEWSGDAWYQPGPGARRRLRQSESVQSKLGGQVLLVEGTGRDSSGAVVFNALATISYSPENGYRLHSHTLDGNEGDFALTLTDSGFVWGFDVPQGHLRYTMHLTPEGTWVETGEFSRDGTTWQQIMEMRVRREQK